MKALNKMLGTLIVSLMGIMVLGCCWQVATRFLLNNPSKYTEEFLRYALIWLTMLGMPYAYGQEKHISINLITKTFQLKNLIKTKMMIEVVILILSIFVLIMGGTMVMLNSVGQISPAMQLPMPIYYACLPISGVLMSFYCLVRLVGFIKEMKEEN
nr:TRAP transporter small permease [Sporanaerobium hydrogeniformans]